MGRNGSLLAIALVVVIFAAGRIVRGGLGFEMSVESIQAWVAALSWKGPLLYLGLVTFRQFLLLPSAILLPVGGLCFGALLGTALGSAGIILSGTLKFSLARAFRLSWRESLTSAKWRTLIGHLEGSGPLIVAVVTAHPVGPMTALHWAAGFSSIPMGGFVIALVAGAIFRAAVYAFLGSTLLAANPVYFYLGCAALLATILLPFAHPGLRRWLASGRATA